MWRNSWEVKLWAQRKFIDVLDPLMMRLLAWRMKVCKNIGRIKIQHNLPIYVPEREKEILKNRQQQAKRLGFSEKVMRILSKAVMHESKRVQKELAKA
jgi:chorismate mutase/prephenate dehydrogenase